MGINRKLGVKHFVIVIMMGNNEWKHFMAARTHTICAFLNPERGLVWALSIYRETFRALKALISRPLHSENCTIENRRFNVEQSQRMGGK